MSFENRRKVSARRAFLFMHQHGVYAPVAAEQFSRDMQKWVDEILLTLAQQFA